MTGYGSAEAEICNKKINVEIKALNGKMTDVRVKLPTMFKELEMPIRKRVLEKALRGKMEIVISIDSKTAEDEFSLNTEMLKKYLSELQAFNREVDMDIPDLMPTVFQFPNVFISKVDEINEEDIQKLYATIDIALNKLSDYRSNEGNTTVKDFELRIKNILRALSDVDQFEGNRLTLLRNRIEKNLNDLVKVDMVDKNRFEQELIYYIEKLDISEEKVRLAQHAQYFLEVMYTEDITKGKKMGFISQEIGREINTLGAKAQSSDIQRLVVEMKDELEKIKEQLANII